MFLCTLNIGEACYYLKLIFVEKSPGRQGRGRGFRSRLFSTLNVFFLYYLIEGKVVLYTVYYPAYAA